MGVKAKVGELDFAVRSHMLLGVMRAAVEEGGGGRWLREVLGVMEPYVRIWDGVWPATEVERGEMLRQILVETGQLFARWKLSPVLKEFSFALGPRE